VNYEHYKAHTNYTETSSTAERRLACGSCHSARLRAKETATFEDTSTKATRVKAMKNKLGKCSKDLHIQVKRCGLLRKRRTLNAADL
jgi:hypothetical protein